MNDKFRIFTCALSLGAVMALEQAAFGQAKDSDAKPASDEELGFNKGELSVSPFGAYVDKTGGKWGAGAALTYYIQKNIGVGASTLWTDLGGKIFDNAEAEGYFRLPLMKKIAPYAVGGIGYEFEGQYWFETIGAGVDFRPFKNIEAFSDIQYRIANNDTRNGAFLRIGVRFTL